MRWTREDCSPVRFATCTVDCETRPLKKHAKWRRQPATRKFPRRVCSSLHFPIRSGPAEAAEPGVAAVVLVGEQAEPEATAGTGRGGGLGATPGRAGRGAVWCG